MAAPSVLILVVLRMMQRVSAVAVHSESKGPAAVASVVWADIVSFFRTWVSKI